MDIDLALVHALVADQHPDLLGPLTSVPSGWDNEVLRLGEDLAVRLPRRRLAVDLITAELRWLPELAPRVPLAVPHPVRVGEPGRGYPWPWAIVRWVPGRTALEAGRRTDLTQLATDLSLFLLALGSLVAPPDAPTNPYRGVPLQARSSALAERLDHLPGDVDRAAVASAWDRVLEVAPTPGPARWVHGDLHPGNLVLSEGRLTGVIDWGDMAVGDPAVDISVAWMVLDGPARLRLRQMIGADDALWTRARGNALAHAVAVLASSADDPAMAAMARRTLDAVLADGTEVGSSSS